MKITGLFHGNMGEEEAGLLEKEGEREHRSTARRQLSAGPQLQWMWSLQSRCVDHLSHTLGLFTWGGSVCRMGREGINPVWLRPNRTEALTVTDKRQTPSLKSTWHQASFSLADAKSMSEALAGGQAGDRPLLTPCSAGLKIYSDRPLLSARHCS